MKPTGKPFGKQRVIVESRPPHRLVMAARDCGIITLTTQEIAATATGSRCALTIISTPRNLTGWLLELFALPLILMLRYQLKNTLELVKQEAERRTRQPT